MLQVVATVMKRKTVSAIFVLVVLYLVMGAAVFRSLEQPHERWATCVATGMCSTLIFSAVTSMFFHPFKNGVDNF